VITQRAASGRPSSFHEGIYIGYTHYWKYTGVLPEEEFRSFVIDVEKLVKYPRVKDLICEEYDEPDAPPYVQAIGVEMGLGLVKFNGKGEQGHETFYFSQRQDGFAFCKTAYKPYDAVVTATLLVAKKHFGDKLEVTSDGSWDEWMAGRDLYRDVFGGPLAACPFPMGRRR